MLPIAMPGLFAGSVQVVSSISLWGTEANGSLALFRQGGLEVVALAGIRSRDLQERLSISTLSINLETSPVTPLFLNDQFGTRSQFYGAQIGSRATWQGERFGFDVTGKLALGATHQSVDIQAYSTQAGPGGVNDTFPGLKVSSNGIISGASRGFGTYTFSITATDAAGAKFTKQFILTLSFR